jgi:hypothetical protein
MKVDSTHMLPSRSLPEKELILNNLRSTRRSAPGKLPTQDVGTSGPRLMFLPYRDKVVTTNDLSRSPCGTVSGIYSTAIRSTGLLKCY